MTVLEREVERVYTGPRPRSRVPLRKVAWVSPASDAFIAEGLLPDFRIPIRGASGLGVTAGAAVLSYEV